IHPLAGLGMNLGLTDAAYFIALQTSHSKVFAITRSLRGDARTRTLDAQQPIALLPGLKEQLEGANPGKKLIRGVGLSLVDNLGPIKHLFAKDAIGK
ncbi:monooxygenase, partial [Pseudoalteromonas sp. S1731]